MLRLMTTGVFYLRVLVTNGGFVDTVSSVHVFASRPLHILTMFNAQNLV